ncbi:MAG: DUF177 domain-containing protein [Pyrinomonadaceae bacterium]|nr:DUF177 domain-containing protein [Pyrinomonadaceae bacterium]
MKIDVTKLDGSASEFSFKIDGENIDLGDDAKVKNSAKISGKVEKHAAETKIHGIIDATVVSECSRCLDKIENDLEVKFSTSFVNPENFSDQPEKELQQDEMEVSVADSSEIDLKELAREQLLLAMPAQNFCREDCKGLCPVCGGNKNLIDCKCEEKETDPRWSALKNLIK